MNSTPRLQHLVLLGAGRAHLEVLHGLAQSRSAALKLSVVAPQPRQLFPARVPGLVAGHFAHDDCVIALEPLLARCGARYHPTRAVSIDADQKTVLLASGETLNFDWLSVNTGSAMERAQMETRMPGAREHALSLHPPEAFARLWPQVAALADRRAIHLAVVGTGTAALELAMAAAHALSGPSCPPGSRVTLVADVQAPGAGFPPGMQRRVLKALRRLNITVLPDACVGVGPGEVLLANGARLVCDAPLLALDGQGPGWLAPSGLDLDEDGFVAVNAFQQSTSHPQVFAAGTVARRADSPQPRDGTHAQRTGAALLANLRAALSGQPLKPWQPPARPLNLLACGGHHAVGAWGDLSFEGGWVWHLKDRIDHRLMARCTG